MNNNTDINIWREECRNSNKAMKQDQYSLDQAVTLFLPGIQDEKIALENRINIQNTESKIENNEDLGYPRKIPEMENSCHKYKDDKGKPKSTNFNNNRRPKRSQRAKRSKLSMLKLPKLFKKLKGSKGLKLAAAGTGATLSGVSFAYDTIEYHENKKERKQRQGTSSTNNASNDVIQDYLDRTKFDQKLTDKKIDAALGFTTLAAREIAIKSKDEDSNENNERSSS